MVTKYQVTPTNSLHLIMEMPYRINKVFYEDSCVQLNQNEMENLVKKRVIELYEMIRVIEKNKDDLTKILDKYHLFQSQLTDIELKHREEDNRISAEELNNAVDYLLKEYFRILITEVYGNENNEISEILFKIGPEFLNNIITAVKAKRVHNFLIDESIPVECNEDGFTGIFMLRKLDDGTGYYINIQEPFRIHIPTKWDKNLEMYEAGSKLEELAKDYFKEAVIAVRYVIKNREKCQELFAKTRQFWDALLDIQYDKFKYPEEGLIKGYDEFRCFVGERYYRMMLDKYIENERIKTFFLNNKLAVLFNILWDLKTYDKENENR